MQKLFESWRKHMREESELLLEELEKTLFHGTVIDYKEKIEDAGLIPIGSWEDTIYDDDNYADDDGDEEPFEHFSSAGGGAVFAADRKGMDNAVGAMRFHIGKKLGKSLTDVTLEDVKKHGMLAVLKEVEIGDIYSDVDKFRQYPDPEELRADVENLPASVESGDHFLTDEGGIGVDFILTGNK